MLEIIALKLNQISFIGHMIIEIFTDVREIIVFRRKSKKQDTKPSSVIAVLRRKL